LTKNSKINILSILKESYFKVGFSNNCLETAPRPDVDTDVLGNTKED